MSILVDVSKQLRDGLIESLESQENRAPGPPGVPIVGHFGNMLGDRLSFLTRSFAEYGEVTRFHFFGLRAHLLSHPNDIAHVLLDSSRKYTKQTRGYRRLSELLGRGLLTSEGSYWRRQRRIAQPAFHRRRLKNFASTMESAASDMNAEWKAKANTNTKVDLHAEMLRITLRVAGETLLGTDPSAHASEVSEAMDVLMHEFHRRINSPFRPPDWVPTKNRSRYNSAIEKLDNLVYGIINDRRRGQEGGDDLLQMLLEAEDADTGQRMNDAQLRDEVITMFLAGHETSANLLSWTLYLLSLAPSYARAIREEVIAHFGQEPLTFDAVKSLELTHRVLMESMRLFPPAWMIGRSPREDDEIRGYRIPAGSLVFLSPWVTHRHPKFWRDPEGFDPDRWLQPSSELHRAQYFPFGLGNRMCIGSQFATMEGIILLGTFLRKYRFDLVPGQTIEPEPLVTLRPKHGIWMTIHEA